MNRVVIIGGGISGLSTAYYLAKAGVASTIIEPRDYLGGVIRTEHVDGCVLEQGPDSFISMKPAAVELIKEVGLGDDVIGSNDHSRKTYLKKNGRLIAMPDGLMMMVPTKIVPVALSPLFGFGTKPVVTIVHDPSQGAALALVRGLLTQHVMEAVSQTAFGNASPGLNANLMAQLRESVTGSTGLPTTRQKDLLTLFDSLDRVQQGAASAQAIPASAARQSGGGLSLPFSTESKAATARVCQNYNSFAHSFAGMSVQFILFAGIDLGTSVLLARRMGLWTRLRAAPISRGSLLGSRIASGALIALALLAAIYAAAFAFFGVRIQGSVVGFIGISLAFALLTACFGLLIAALGRTPEATRGLAIFATLLLVMLGGAWVPSFIFPPWLQTASLFVPTRWAIDGFDLMTWRGGDLQSALAPIGVTLGFALVFGAIGVWRFPTEQDGGPAG